MSTLTLVLEISQPQYQAEVVRPPLLEQQLVSTTAIQEAALSKSYTRALEEKQSTLSHRATLFSKVGNGPDLPILTAEHCENVSDGQWRERRWSRRLCRFAAAVAKELAHRCM